MKLPTIKPETIETQFRLPRARLRTCRRPPFPGVGDSTGGSPCSLPNFVLRTQIATTGKNRTTRWRAAGVPRRQMGKSLNRHRSLGRAAVHACTVRPQQHHGPAIPERSTRPKKSDGRSQHRGRPNFSRSFVSDSNGNAGLRRHTRARTRHTRPPRRSLPNVERRISRAAAPDDLTSGNSTANAARTDHVGKYGTAVTVRNRTG